MDKIIASLKDLSDVDALVVFDAENDYQVFLLPSVKVLISIHYS